MDVEMECLDSDSDTSYIPSDSDTSSTDGSSFIDTEIDPEEIEDLYQEENELRLAPL